MERVLAVDDNPRNLAIIEKMIAGEFLLVTAGSGEEALEIAPRFRPDVILLDIMMPGIDGYETCRRIRALNSLATTKIIMVSARATVRDRLDGYAAGANDYVVKPFDQDELMAKLRVYARLKSVEEVDRLKSDFLSLLKHETFTPLTLILGPATLLLEERGLPAHQRKLVEMIRTGGVRMRSLIDRVSYLGELKSGLVQPVRALLDAEAVITRATTAARAKVGREDVGIEAEVGSPFQVEADERQLGFVLEALLDNALRLSPPSSVVRVHAHSTGPWATFVVSDSGPGIDRQFIERVFDEFAMDTIDSHADGIGLSLATARLIVEKHGGTLTVVSESGSGATFEVLLPARDAMTIAA